MITTYAGTITDLTNECDNPKKNFSCTFHGYEICVTHDRVSRFFRKNVYEAWCYATQGKAIVHGEMYHTLQEAVQACLNAVYAEEHI